MSLDYQIPAQQSTAETEFNLILGRDIPAYHAGACTRDIQTTPYRKVERVVVGKIRVNTRTEQIVE